MKCFYKELSERKKYLITKIHNEVAALGDSWFRHEITDEQYCLRKQMFFVRLMKWFCCL